MAAATAAGSPNLSAEAAQLLHDALAGIAQEHELGAEDMLGTWSGGPAAMAAEEW